MNGPPTGRQAYLGIDPGLDGGLAIVGPDGQVVEPMPTIEGKKGRLSDLPALRDWLTCQRGQVARAFIAEAQMRPVESRQSTLKCGRGFGNIEGMLVALAIPYEIVHAARWTKEMHAGVEGRIEGRKGRSLMAVSRLFPGVCLKKTDRCRVSHDGMAEALLIAEYGRRRMTRAG